MAERKGSGLLTRNGSHRRRFESCSIRQGQGGRVWIKAAVLKTAEGNTSVGSNPTPAAMGSSQAVRQRPVKSQTTGSNPVSPATGCVAQLVERQVEALRVGGANPSATTMGSSQVVRQRSPKPCIAGSTPVFPANSACSSMSGKNSMEEHLARDVGSNPTMPIQRGGACTKGGDDALQAL